MAVGLVAVAGCGGDPAPAGYERWSGGGATFIYPEEWQEEDRPAEFKAAGLKFVAGSRSARVMVLEDTGRDLYAFMAETLGSGWLDQNVHLRLRPRERIEVPGAEAAFRREATAGDAVMSFVFASHDARNHMALVLVTKRSGAGELDEGPILDSFVLD